MTILQRMLQRSFKIIVVLLFFSVTASAQFTRIVKTGERNHQTVDSMPSYGLKRSIIAPNHYANQLGFFCRQELKFEKMAPIPFRFRLGSIDYVNWMERKPNAVMLSR